MWPRDSVPLEYYVTINAQLLTVDYLMPTLTILPGLRGAIPRYGLFCILYANYASFYQTEFCLE